MLTAVPITTDSKDFKEIKHLYIAAFPKSERVPLRDLLRHDGASEFVAGYDGETFCGFYSALTFGDITHILFLAIDERLRAHGYGSAMLDIVAAAHPHNRIIADPALLTSGAEFRTRYSFGAEPSPSRNSKAFGTTSMRRNARKCENSGAPRQSAVPDGQLNLRKENAKACDAH